ncbi:hypothetical protein TM7_0620 [candidate division TM7 genomosp. GTL1]|nr:hypothetical protein TM7_0620 [candidate division TM7 genomosp. GTL1]
MSKLEVSVVLDGKYAQSKRELMPLFLQLAWLMSATLQGILPGKHGVFSFDDGFRESKEGVGIRNIFKVAHGTEFNIKELLSSVKEVVTRINDDNGFVRLTDRLGSLSYSDGSFDTPNIEKNYEDTLILMGTNGWREIATEYNCTELLNHTSVKMQ